MKSHPNTLNHRDAFTAVMLLLVHVSCYATAALVRPSAVRFAFYEDLQSGLYNFDVVQQYVGLQAAMKEANDANVVDGVQLEVVYYPAPSVLNNTNATLLAAAHAVASLPEVFGFVAPDYGSSPYVRQVAQVYFDDALPIIAARGLLADNGAKSDMKLRQPLRSEFLMMLRHAVSNPNVRCTAFTIVKSSAVPISLSNAYAVLVGMGYPAPLLYDYGSTTLNVTRFLNTWAAGSPATQGFIPMCGLFFTSSRDFKVILEQMYTDPRFPMDRMRFYGCGLASEGVFNSSMHGTAPFSSVRFATNFQAPNSTVDPLVINFRTAVNAWATTFNFNTLPADMQSTRQ
ncbi:membrane-associated protein, putative [Bodo saltans]|uniref:Membrane-associated protein, putative n=1 Tax=Bodo saltans TaxID=75058 RepID=A0A0S4IZN1_BODSA|nr:membrane-associated protein, putative [Bodo saltans]|eukprot:CUG22571.1 membrane-associated protein, putative [Bodo saltans]